MRKLANCIHHTHWDLLWYFTAQDAQVQFSYNFKEMLKAFDEGKINQFFLDGQTAPVDEYLRNNPSDIEKVRELVSDERLVIGPFNAQLDCFISSGESVINNLRLGIKSAKKLGNVSKIAYLPDSFGHSIDFPKIFNLFGIYDFVITRGVGDHYGLDSEFLWESKDKSQLKVFTMIAGYGYGCYPFKNKTLFEPGASDYNKIDIKKLIERVISYSALENDFVFLLGFDQNPIMFDIDQNIKYYNDIQNEFEFIETNWKDYFKKIEANRHKLKVHHDELFSTQYHRVHRSMFSTRSDIKTIQDEVERVLTYQVQPMMSMLDYLGIDYDHGLIDSNWEKLLFTQTHSSATLTDETNQFIKRESINSLNLAQSTLTFLCKVLSLSTQLHEENSTPLFVVNTLPNKRNAVAKYKVYTKSQSFRIEDRNGKAIEYAILKSTKKNHGVLRKHIELLDEDKFHYEHDLLISFKELSGIGYDTYYIKEGVRKDGCKLVSTYNRSIENEYYKIYHNERGICILNKKTNILMERAICLEDGGDEGDSYDYSFPDHDLICYDFFEEAQKDYSVYSFGEKLTIRGNMMVPDTLNDRKFKRLNSKMTYEINIELSQDDTTIRVNGSVMNEAKQHRVRLIFANESSNNHSFAGTQYGFIQRVTYQKEMSIWKEQGWFEEPSATYPLLNHVSAKGENQTTTIFTRSSKEYEFVNEGFKDIAITLFRAYGAMGYPDLNRRPGRPSGLDYMIFETPDSQMNFENKFDLGFAYYSSFNANQITNDYINFATDLVLYQKQSFDKSFKPIDYFPTNPTGLSLPESYKFLVLDDFQGSFGSIVKDDHSPDYILRLFNNDTHSIFVPERKGGLTKCQLVDTDLDGNDHQEFKGEIKGEELRIIRIRRK